MIRNFFPQWRIYGFSVAFWSLVFPLHRLFVCFRPFFGVKKHGAILAYLNKRYGEVIKAAAGKNRAPESFIGHESTIWVCWWDGEESMPPLVKVCYRSILKHAGTHPVQLITKNNCRDFISIPEYVLDKVNAGIITITHFSDILRANLLYEYGGIWMDITILVLADITFGNLAFYTLKAPSKISASISLARFAGLSNASYTPETQHDGPQISRWSGFLFAGNKNSVIFELIRDILHAYWKDHNDQIEYLLYDYAIALGYDNIPVIREMIDNVPCSNAEKFEMEKSLNVEYSEECFSLFFLTPFHKLTWKKAFNVYTKNNKLTIYGYLLKQFC
jgi:hypothetical protein